MCVEDARVAQNAEGVCPTVDVELVTRRAIEGTVIGGEQVLGEGQRGRDPPHLRPEAAPHAILVAREPVDVPGDFPV